jgi:hypothetical protein
MVDGSIRNLFNVHSKVFPGLIEKLISKDERFHPSSYPTPTSVLLFLDLGLPVEMLLHRHSEIGVLPSTFHRSSHSVDAEPYRFQATRQRPNQTGNADGSANALERNYSVSSFPLN